MANKSKYTLQEVTSPQLAREFLNLPKRIYKGNRNWVCPLDEDIEKVFDPARNPLFGDGEAIRWLVRNRKNEVVGRIAAFYNREQAAIEEQPTGGCGFFEAINDQEVADLLFDAARMWLASRGMEAMDGPINFGPRDTWWGLLVEGYEFQPLYKNPYNPPYYKELFENYGFKNYFNQHSFIWRANVSEASERIFDRAERLLSTPGYHVENIDMNNLEDAAENFRLVYNKAWALFSGVRPMAQEEAMQMMKAMKPIIDPDIIFFAYFNDEPVGFFIMVPDLNRVIGRFHGKMNLVNKLRLMAILKCTHKADRVFAIIFGVAPEYHGRGIESGIMHEFEQTVARGEIHYKTLELAWMGDFNPVMIRMVENYVCAHRNKTHVTYRYLFDRTKEFKRCPRLGVKRN